MYIPLRDAGKPCSQDLVQRFSSIEPGRWNPRREASEDPGYASVARVVLNIFCRSGTFNGRILEVPCIR